MSDNLFKRVLRSLQGESVYHSDPLAGPEIDDPAVEQTREAMGGALQLLTQTSIRWYLADIEAALHASNQGDLSRAGQLYRAMLQSDPTFAGLLAQRCGGLVGLPKRFFGKDPAILDELAPKNGSRSVFEEMVPPAEVSLLAADGEMMGIGVAELVPVTGRSYPVLVRLDPEFLQFRWQEQRFYYRSAAGALPVTPGDGRWVLHVPGGRLSPWQHGLWPALGRAFVAKQHALLYRDAYIAKLANPARYAKTTLAATEPQRLGFLNRLIAWGVNTVFELPPGWEVGLLETHGRGWEVFRDAIDASDREYMIALAGQVVTTTGGSGFISADLFKSIRSDLIKATGDALAYTINSQVLPAYAAVYSGRGVEALEAGTMVQWDTTPPKDLKQEADSMHSASEAIKSLGETLRSYDLAPNVPQLAERFGIPVVALEKKEVTEAKLDLAPTDLAKTIRVDEARASRKLGPLGDDRGALLIGELDALLKPQDPFGGPPGAPSVSNGQPPEPDEAVKQGAEKE